MTKFAHSLGYPHPDMMLAQMTAFQFQELLHFFHIEEEEKERMEAEAQENRLRIFMERKMAEQEKEK